MAENSKLKILYILDIMKKTDEKHPVNSTQIAAKLKAYGIKAERKSIGRDLECLEDAGYEIVKCENHNMGWYMIGQEFEDHELKMLVDSVAAAKFLTIEDSRRLIKKIKKLATPEGERLIDATLIMDEETKLRDKQFNLKFDTIMRAIAEKKQLRFQYIELTDGNKKVLKWNGHVYQVSPYYIVLSGEEYFLIANPITHNHVTHFRIEMITGLDVYDEQSRPMSEVVELQDVGKGKSIEDYIRENVNMWIGESTDVVLHAGNGLRHDVMQKFGKNLFIRDDGEGGFTVHIKVANSEGFYFWLAAYGPSITIESPDYMRDGFVDFLRKSQANYE